MAGTKLRQEEDPGRVIVNENKETTVKKRGKIKGKKGSHGCR